MPDSASPLDPDPVPAPGSVALATLLASRQDGCGMPRAFYTTEALYAAELQRVWRNGWLFAGFAFEVPNPGDFLTLAVGDAPILVIRGDDGLVRAFHNVCRHRGSQICRTQSGHARALV
ncbi:MAG: Rieske 2Fe-2S domain-containing protein, partial [Betaproteobacteria bacterium]|nr:Rieske 2Fe-2S domain-containing protein [Betaproteobacteria bacterium]